MRKGQLSIIDLFITMIAVSVSTSFLLLINPEFNELRLRYKNYHDKQLLISLFNYGTMSTEVSEYLCNGAPDPFDKAVSIIETLTDENFIMFIENKSWVPEKISGRLADGGLLFYNNETSVCLDNINLIKFNLLTNCGELIINYGSWRKGEGTC